MAIGKYGGYRDNEYRDLESDVSRRELFNSKDYDRAMNGGRDVERGRAQDVRDRMRVRQKDVKEREITNGGYRSSSRSDSGSSGGGKCGPRGGDLTLRAVDREPGELSSESGSEVAIDFDFQAKATESVKVTENGARSPVERKRKFSSIVWERDDKEGNNFSRNRKSPDVTTLPPVPPLPKVYHESPDPIPDGGVQISPIRDSKSQKLMSSSQGKVPAVTASESPVGFAPSPSDEQLWGNGQDVERLEDEDYVPTQNILSSSRWAYADSSPVDEGEFFVVEEMPKRKKMPASESLQNRARNKLATSELGLLREGSEAVRGRSSSDERDARSRSGSRDDYIGYDLGKEDYMEVDNEYHKADGTSSQSDSDTEDESNSEGTPEPAAPPQRSINMLQGCRSVEEFERLNKIDEGTYGVVFRARDRKTGEIVALKKVKMEKEREGFPLTSLREINILLSFHHPSIVDVKEVVVGGNLDNIFMVMEYMEHDLKGLMESMKQPFSQSEVKCLMLQLLEGVKYLHDNWVLHRDLKTSNLLLNNQGELKICDFGLARQYGSPLKPYTSLVVTLWYRAPELLLGAKQYSTAIDMWSLGCIMAELLSKEPLFNGKSEVDQLDKIFRTLGTPNETIWLGVSKLPLFKVNFAKHQYNLLRKKFPATSFTGSPVLSDAGFDLLNKLLTYDPEKRITVEAALNHEWFREVPLPKSKDFMPTFPAQHVQDRRMRRILKSPDPLEEQRRKELQQLEGGTGGLFG